MISFYSKKNGIENNTVIKVGFTLTFDFKTGPCLYKTCNMPKKSSVTVAEWIKVQLLSGTVFTGHGSGCLNPVPGAIFLRWFRL